MLDKQYDNEEDKKQSDSSSDNEDKVDEGKIPEPFIRNNENKTNLIVLMKAQTWDRESHGLYDYESRRVQKLEHKTECEGIMIRSKDNVEFLDTDGNFDPEEDTKLFKLKKKAASNGSIEKFYVSPFNDNQPNDRLWLVIRSLKEGYIIKKHDILKLGRMKFKVKEFKTANEFFEGDHLEKGPHEGFEELHEVELATGEEMSCRICYETINTEDNPII